jgi:putative Mn2+ efflux pump MntP
MMACAAMDAFALSVVRAMTRSRFQAADAVTTSVFFGAAQR